MTTLSHATRQPLGLALALLSAAIGLGLVSHYPLQGLLAAALWLLLAALSYRHWQAMPLLPLALLPWIGLAPWTGWLSFEELDLLVLAVASGAYAGWARKGDQDSRVPAWQRPLAYGGLAKLLLLLCGVSTLLALWRGVADAGGWQFGWYQGYHEPMNSLRQAKPLLLVLLLLPLWRAASARQPAAFARRFAAALVLALAGCLLPALWERLAYAGLLSFSSDYRSSALFWEMHVGGAALDAALVLSLPFALAGLWQAHRPRRRAALLALLGLAVYIGLTNFSRGLYLAAPVGLGLCSLLLLRQAAAASAAPGAPAAAAAQLRPALSLALIALHGLAAWWIFPGGGWRALLALSGSALLLLNLPATRLPGQSAGQRLLLDLTALLGALLALGLTVLFATWVPKGEYLFYGLALGSGLLLQLVWLREGPRRQLQACALLAGWLWCLGTVAVVAGSWGGAPAWEAALLPLALIALAGLATQWLPAPAGQMAGRGKGRKLALWMLTLLLITLVGTLSGGDRFDERGSDSERAWAARLQHWQRGLELLRTPADWALGRGAGRFVANYYQASAGPERPGDYRLIEAAGEPSHLRLSGGQAAMDWNELLRVGQRVRAPQGLLKLTLRLRSSQAAALHLELCEKHLLDTGACVSRVLQLAPQPGWQPLTLDLGLPGDLGGDWWAPRLLMFSMALEAPGAAIDVAAVSLQDDGGELLANHDFSAGLAHWFFTSDRHHLPWHIKSLPLHLLFEQGLLGLGLWTALLLAVLWRCMLGAARRHALAAPLAGALLGFAILGLFDSLLDVPRIAFLFHALLLLGLGLRSPPRPPA